MNSILPIAQGVASAGFLTYVKREEDSVRYGENHLLTGVYQTMQAGEGLAQINRALEAASYTPLSLIVTSIISLAPLAIAYTTAQDYFGPDLYLLYDALGTLCQIAGVVSSIALIALGQMAFGATSLVLLGIGFLDRQGILPENVRQVVHATTYPLTMVAGIFAGDIITQAYCLANVIMLVRSAYQNRMNPEAARRAQEMEQPLAPIVVPVTPEQLTPQHRMPAPLEQERLVPNRKHIRYSAMPPIPNADVRQLTQLCDAIDWNHPSNRRALDRKLANDARWVRRFSGESTGCLAQCLAWLRPRLSHEAYMKAQLRIFADSIHHHQVLVGEPVNYELMHNYLKVITDRLPHLDEMTRADILLNLAIDGGEYCGPGKYRVVAEAYQIVMSDALTEIPLETRVLTLLQQKRVALFQGPIFAAIQTLGTADRATIPIGDEGMALNDVPVLSSVLQMLRGMDLTDVHTYNRLVNLVGRDIGLPRQGAEEDGSAQIDPAITAVLSPIVRELFWTENNTDAIVNSVREALGSPTLPLNEVYEWWRQWITRRCPIDTHQARIDELAQANLFGVALEEDLRYIIQRNNVQVERTRPTFKDVFIKAMLLEMGILQRPVAINETVNPLAQFLGM